MRSSRVMLSARMIFTVGILAILLLSLTGSPKAQGRPARSRIERSVSDSSIVRLQNTTHPRIYNSVDKGRVQQDLPMERAVLMLSSSPEQEKELEHLLEEQQDPSSPRFHHWLTPEEFGEQFGASTGEIASVAHWLQSHGF